MKRICLDTDFLVALLRKRKEAEERAGEYDAAGVDVATTSMNAFEIYLGAYRSKKRERNLREVDELLESLKILQLTKENSRKSSEILSRLLNGGTPIDLRDAIIGGIALNEGYTLITRNIDHFKRITGLSVEMW